MKKTPAQVTAEINALKAVIHKVPRSSYFGDDNHGAIRAQIKALEENMSQNEVWDSFEDGSYIQDSATSAVQWRDGDSDETPSEDWGGMVK